jgi:hypothetical protein
MVGTRREEVHLPASRQGMTVEGIRINRSESIGGLWFVVEKFCSEVFLSVTLWLCVRKSVFP